MRTILHSDLNNFYASVECLRRPEIKDKPVVVTGSKEDRHGVVLAKNMIAKKLGVKTGDVYWEARKKCGESLVEVQADFSTYLQVSREVRKIYADYTDMIESYGIDECWLDVTSCLKLFGSGEKLADEIRRRIKDEIGVTVSIGVSWNKIFAKLGSDMKKPDAVTVITPENYKQKVWTLPVEELLYVGKATKEKLNRTGIKTIGNLANADRKMLEGLLGKWGYYLHTFANGNDDSPVKKSTEEQTIKSIGNSITTPRDLRNDGEVESVIYMLADSVAARLREAGIGKARTVYVSARSNKLISYGKQCKLPRPTSDYLEIAKTAQKLFTELYPWTDEVRSVGVSVSDFMQGAEQLDMFGDGEKEARRDRLYSAIDGIRKKYGNNIIQSATVSKDPKLKSLDIKGEHVIHPVGFMKNNNEKK